LNIGVRIGKPADREQCQAARKIGTPRRSAATPSTVNKKNYLPLLRALGKIASVGDLFFGCKADGPSERLIYGSAATNSTPGLAELATIHSTYSPRVAIGDGLRSIDIYRNTA
jgi:hypothetical protein